jgi:hypothetical protein
LLLAIIFAFSIVCGLWSMVLQILLRGISATYSHAAWLATASFLVGLLIAEGRWSCLAFLSLFRVSGDTLSALFRLRSKSCERGQSVALGAILLLVATGCGGGRQSSPPPPQQSNQDGPPASFTPTAVTTFHNNNARTGANLTETWLTPSNVNGATFGKRAAITVQGDVFAQPLYVPGVTAGQGSHNLIIVATEHDQVYAIDADTRQIAWHQDFLGSSGSVTTLHPSDLLNCTAIAPEVGITGTPVIDTTTSTIYVVVRTKETQSGQPVFYQRLHALDLTTGQDKLTPTIIASPPDPNGEFGAAQFDPVLNNQRSALLLTNGQVYVAWASHCDLGTYQGWVMAFDATTLQLTGAWTPSPSGTFGGIWMAGSGPASDASGDVYLPVGNGPSDAMTGGSNYGDSVVRLHNSANQISAIDYFIPFDWKTLFDDDLDLGSAGSILLPDQTGAAHPHLLAVAGKDATVYLLDRDNLGHWQPSDDGQVLQSFKSDSQHNFSTPAFWNNTFYFGWFSGPLEAFRYEPTSQQIDPTPISSTGSWTLGYPGASPSVSANGTSNGIVWVLRNNGTDADLRAYDATNLNNELYDSEMSPERDNSGPSVTFGVPTVADGWVFVGTRGEVDIYGLLSR